MPEHFDLVITADYPARTAEFTLNDASGVQLAWRRTDFKEITASRQRGLFDLRNYLRHYVEEGREAAAVAETGVCIAEEVLGQEIFERLWASKSHRTLRIRLPGLEDQENHLIAALARVPWEIARPAADQDTLADRALVVRVVHEMAASASTPIPPEADGTLRVLFVFAEARGSRPLGARRERRELRALFEKEIYPQRRVAAHFLTHGVTRERLTAQVQEQGGYHIVHWSGHGHMNQLELCRPDGKPDLLSGPDLLELFTEAGGFLPRLFFLSACHSGGILRVEDWHDFLAVAQGREPDTKETGAEAGTRDLDLKEQPGYTGTAHALLQGGVPSVVAMRYAVGDDYAREMAVEFYRALLAHSQPKEVATALTMARQAMRDSAKHQQSRFSVGDHATPLLYGGEQAAFVPVKGRSAELNPRNPRRHQIPELTTREHEHFVGRTWELTGLGAAFIGSGPRTEAKSTAVITGLGGMGKTALAAEALALWEFRFEHVLLYQAKPGRLEFETTLRDIHLKLMEEGRLYHDHVRTYPNDAVYREATAEFTGSARMERLTRNLLRTLQDEAILLVLDNFETCLKPQSQPQPAAADGPSLWSCQDAAWDACLHLLAQELPGCSSRVLITCRRPLAALPGSVAHGVLLGPLPAAEAALFLKEQPVLSHMIFGGDAGEKALAMRLLNASRFHPLLMDRLAKLAADPSLRGQLLKTLEELQKTREYGALLALFTAKPGDERELAYLNDALHLSLDQLIRDSSPDARRLLWIIALANQPEALGLVRGVWGGESYGQEQLREIKKMLNKLPLLSPELQEKLKAMPAELRAQIDGLPSEAPAVPGITPLLSQLVSVGLVTEQRGGPDDDNPNLACHELVRERILAWMEQQPQDQGELTENIIRLAYAERLAAAFDGLKHKNMTAVLEAGSRALVYCVQAEDWDRLDSFAGSLINNIHDPRQLEALIPHLETAAESAPAGRPRWTCLCYLADALDNSGRHDSSLRFFDRAATQARTAAEAGDSGSQQAWWDFGLITGNWAVALYKNGSLNAARQRHLESAKAKKMAGQSAIQIIGSELEALRIEIDQGQVCEALPEVEKRLIQLEDWWRRYCSGQTVPEAPKAEILAKTLIGALDVASSADFALKDWASALNRIETSLEVMRVHKHSEEVIAGARMNRATVLQEMNQFREAQIELETCLSLFLNDPNRRATVLGALADLFNAQSDFNQAIIQQRRALALQDQLPNPEARAISHANLSGYLNLSGTLSDLAEASHHRLAGLIYFLVSGFTQNAQMVLRNYVIYFRRAHTAGLQLAVPRLSELLAKPAFAALDQWLRQREVELEELQAGIDELLEQARQKAFSDP